MSSPQRHRGTWFQFQFNQSNCLRCMKWLHIIVISLLMVAITSHIFINTCLLKRHFSAVNFTTGYGKNIAFFWHHNFRKFEKTKQKPNKLKTPDQAPFMLFSSFAHVHINIFSEYLSTGPWTAFTTMLTQYFITGAKQLYNHTPFLTCL